VSKVPAEPRLLIRRAIDTAAGGTFVRRYLRWLETAASSDGPAG